MRAADRRGLVALTAAVAIVVSASARADSPPAADPIVVTTTETTAATTTEPAPTTTEAAPVPATLAIAAAPDAGCPPVGAVGLLQPHSRPIVLAPDRQLSTAQVAYPADGSILTASGMSLDSSCSDTRPAGGTVQVRGVSLFGGAITASSATLDLTSGAGRVAGLTVGGRPVTLAPGHALRVGNWGYLIAPDPAAASHSAFEVELATEHAGLPAGTLVFVPYARIEVAGTAPQAIETTAAPARRTAPRPATTTSATPTTTPTATRISTIPPAPAVHDEGFTRPPSKHVRFHRRKPRHEPLTVTPPLEGGPYVFPVAGTPIFGDTYGGLRTDVAGGWHHGDDIFAPLGTPVVAVANGTLNRIGWERLGGWRLWVRDDAGDQFYYAHLSGYSPLALARGRVHRGDVIGFVGNTGDAFTTMPHLHFEIHPRGLLHLHYDGAVNPTSYLQSWPRPDKLNVPHPVHPRLPRSAAWRHEAALNFRELLAARGFARRPRPANEVVAPPLVPPLRAPYPIGVAAPTPTVAQRSSNSLAWALGAAGWSALALAVALWWRRREG